MGLPWDAGALGAIAKFLGLGREAVIAKYYGRIVTEDGKRYVEMDEAKRRPCPFLTQENTCSIYEARPTACRLVPGQTPPAFDSLECLALQPAQQGLERAPGCTTRGDQPLRHG